MNEYYKDFKKYWLSNYIEQYANSNNKEKRVIKENLYKNINLKESQKDYLWQEIVRRSIDLGKQGYG